MNVVRHFFVSYDGSNTSTVVTYLKNHLTFYFTRNCLKIALRLLTYKDFQPTKWNIQKQVLDQSFSVMGNVEFQKRESMYF